MKIVSYAGMGLGAFLLVTVLALLLFADPLLNRFVKPEMTERLAEAYPAFSVRIANMTFSVLKNRTAFDSVALNAVDGTF